MAGSRLGATGTRPGVTARLGPLRETVAITFDALDAWEQLRLGE
jgi:hypothetical protein